MAVKLTIIIPEILLGLRECHVSSYILGILYGRPLLPTVTVSPLAYTRISQYTHKLSVNKILSEINQQARLCFISFLHPQAPVLGDRKDVFFSKCAFFVPESTKLLQKEYIVGTMLFINS